MYKTILPKATGIPEGMDLTDEHREYLLEAGRYYYFCPYDADRFDMIAEAQTIDLLGADKFVEAVQSLAWKHEVYTEIEGVGSLSICRGDSWFNPYDDGYVDEQEQYYVEYRTAQGGGRSEYYKTYDEALAKYEEISKVLEKKLIGVVRGIEFLRRYINNEEVRV